MSKMTPEQVRLAGLKALARDLGSVGMVRFLQQFEMGQGNYTAERHTWPGKRTVRELVDEIEHQRKTIAEQLIVGYEGGVMPNTEIQCPNCGSFATLPKPGDARRLLEEILHGRLAFDNPKWVQAFQARKIGAVCDTCKYEFDLDTPVRARSSGAANVAAEKRSPAERMKDLLELRAAGLITEEEFQRKRDDILRGL